MVRLYLELARRSFQQQFAYRGATLAGIFTNSVFGVMIASVFLALYNSQGDSSAAVEGWTKDQTITLVWINQALLMTVYMWGWWEIARSIQSGAIVNELLKPYDFFFHWMARDLGRGFAQFFIRAIPTFTVGVIFFNILAPTNVVAALGFGVSIALAVATSFCLRFIINVLGFWVLDYRGLGMMFAAVLNALSGLLLPLAFFPTPIRQIANVLPFRAVLMTPNEIYLGQVHIWEGLGFQILWIVVLIAAGRYLMSLGERQLVVQGG